MLDFVHKQYLSYYQNNMNFLPNNFIRMICRIKNEDCEE